MADEFLFRPLAHKKLTLILAELYSETFFALYSELNALRINTEAKKGNAISAAVQLHIVFEM